MGDLAAATEAPLEEDTRERESETETEVGDEEETGVLPREFSWCASFGNFARAILASNTSCYAFLVLVYCDWYRLTTNSRV